MPLSRATPQPPQHNSYTKTGHEILMSVELVAGVGSEVARARQVEVKLTGKTLQVDRTDKHMGKGNAQGQLIGFIHHKPPSADTHTIGIERHMNKARTSTLHRHFREFRIVIAGYLAGLLNEIGSVS
ncbi:hypothetical protein E2C01_026744 [Portunus trituberculatus]|uniref:Uncharacterized protein n=1 Tax=Portunus trituberculatus TaxID=210409 RepID=A0A5B7EIZ9_PORTR|nr:hypothetical protein [Portunus trituberculatus]